MYHGDERVAHVAYRNIADNNVKIACDIGKTYKQARFAGRSFKTQEMIDETGNTNETDWVER